MKGCHLDTGSKWLSLSSRIQAMLLQLQDSTLIMSTHTLEQMHTYLVSKHVSLELPVSLFRIIICKPSDGVGFFHDLLLALLC
ncbi:hypothetical protein KC19_3G078400 [Ceratodon purpureus]|uniref:Uncharacterized protein n=1 Tax=Ceratodon purpureus TaxID=3225 RepID=A0A8T0IH99_CERPU|nr:hypothetical protein KC19_3G078400 [Ceratodon purpureus]